AGALALATMGSSLALADDSFGSRASESAARTGIVVTSAHIARLKRVLKLTPEQARYWPAVEAALHGLTRRGAVLGRGAAGGASAGVGRVMAAAYPLIQALDEGQKRDALRMARSMGITNVAQAF